MSAHELCQVRGPHAPHVLPTDGWGNPAIHCEGYPVDAGVVSDASANARNADAVDDSGRSIVERSVPVALQGDGVLWAINRQVFHPRGFALAVDPATGDLSLQGDGLEPWQYAESMASVEDQLFAAFELLLARARVANGEAPPPYIQRARELIEAGDELGAQRVILAGLDGTDPPPTGD